MTIDEAISHLDTYSSTMGSGQTTQEQHEDAKRVAIATMRKYQKLEQEPTTKNDLGVDCVARKDVERYIEGFINEYTPREELEFINLELNGLKHLPSVTPQEPQSFKWCTDCKEYDQEKHCCHRWSKVIRDTVEEMKQEPKTGHWVDCDDSDDYSADGYDCSVCGVNAEYATSYCPNCGARMVE